MKSNQGRKGGGGSKDLRAGLKYNSRLEVSERARRRGSQDALRPGCGPDRPRARGPGLCRRRRGRGVSSAAGSCGSRGRPGPGALRFVLAEGPLHCPLVAGALAQQVEFPVWWVPDLRTFGTCLVCAGEAGMLRVLEKPNLQPKK